MFVNHIFRVCKKDTISMPFFKNVVCTKNNIKTSKVMEMLSSLKSA